MIKIKEAIIVEGRYDVNTVKQLVDTIVLETGGFRIFSDKERLSMFRQLARTRGLLILTDSDGAGMVIRNYLKGAIPPSLYPRDFWQRISQAHGIQGGKTWRRGYEARCTARGPAQGRRNNLRWGRAAGERPLSRPPYQKIRPLCAGAIW